MELAAYSYKNQLSYPYGRDKRDSYSERNKRQAALIYADEADLLNTALFGLTAKEWRERNSSKSGNIRDYAGLEQLVVLSNLESINALLIKQGLSQRERLIQLNKTAIT